MECDAMNIDKLYDFINENNITVEVCPELQYFKKAALFCTIKGKNLILLNDNFYERPNCERVEILAEECGHYATTVGDMTIANSYKEKLDIDKAELKATQWGSNFLINMDSLKSALLTCQTLEEVLEELDVSYNVLNTYMTKLSLQGQYLELDDVYKLNLYKLPSLIKERNDIYEAP